MGGAIKNLGLETGDTKKGQEDRLQGQRTTFPGPAVLLLEPIYRAPTHTASYSASSTRKAHGQTGIVSHRNTRGRGKTSWNAVRCAKLQGSVVVGGTWAARGSGGLPGEAAHAEGGGSTCHGERRLG